MCVCACMMSARDSKTKRPHTPVRARAKECAKKSARVRERQSVQDRVLQLRWRVCMYIVVYIYTYIHVTQRSRQRQGKVVCCLPQMSFKRPLLRVLMGHTLHIYINVYIYICVHIRTTEREREREKRKEREPTSLSRAFTTYLYLHLYLSF